MFEQRASVNGRTLAAPAGAVDRLPAGTAAETARELAPATVRSGALTLVTCPTGRRASAPGTGAVVNDRVRAREWDNGRGKGTGQGPGCESAFEHGRRLVFVHRHG